MVAHQFVCAMRALKEIGGAWGKGSAVATLEELYTSFAEKPGLDEIETRLGIEKITVTLLENRLAEDLDAIAALPRTEVI